MFPPFYNGDHNIVFKTSTEPNLMWKDIESFKLFLFDLDDTLINTRQSVQVGWKTALEHSSFLPSDFSFQNALTLLEFLSSKFGTSADLEYWHAFVTEILHCHLPYPHPIAIQLCETYRNAYWKTLTPFNHVLPFLNTLKENNKFLSLISNGEKKFQNQKLKHTQLDKFFDPATVFISSQFPSSLKKPSPFMINKALEKFSISPTQTLFFGNADTDIIAGNLAGIRTTLVFSIPNSSHQSRLLNHTFHLSSWDML